MDKHEEFKVKGLTSKILDVIRAEVKATEGLGPVSSDYYAKQANPKDGGYAKSNYIKGDHQRFLREDLVVDDLAIRVRPRLSKQVQLTDQGQLTDQTQVLKQTQLKKQTPRGKK
jgi:hypothetical protein